MIWSRPRSLYGPVDADTHSERRAKARGLGRGERSAASPIWPQIPSWRCCACYLPPRIVAPCCAIAKVMGMYGASAGSIGSSPKLYITTGPRREWSMISPRPFLRLTGDQPGLFSMLRAGVAQGHLKVKMPAERPRQTRQLGRPTLPLPTSLKSKTNIRLRHICYAAAHSCCPSDLQPLHRIAPRTKAPDAGCTVTVKWLHSHPAESVGICITAHRSKRSDPVDLRRATPTCLPNYCMQNTECPLPATARRYRSLA